MKLRSVLIVPGDSQSAVAKAAMLASDALVLDLHGPLTQKAKTAARGRAVSWLKSKRRKGLMVRSNAQASEQYLSDLAALVPARPAAVMLPRCGGLRDLTELDHHLEAIEAAHGVPRGATRVLAAIDTLAAVRSMSYCGAPRRLIGLCFGAEDLAAELGISPRGADGAYRAPLLQARAQFLVAAAEAGVAAIDAAFPDPLDAKGLAREVRAAAEGGFTGKLCIHASQVAPVTAAFTSTAERAEWARRIKRAFEAAPDADVLTLDGKAVSRLQLRAAERISSAFE